MEQIRLSGGDLTDGLLLSSLYSYSMACEARLSSGACTTITTADWYGNVGSSAQV
jgi:hypothetical protein